MISQSKPLYIAFLLDFSSSMRKKNKYFINQLSEDENYKAILSRIEVEINRLKQLRKIEKESRPIYISCLIYGVDSRKINWSYIMPHYKDEDYSIEKKTIWDFGKAYNMMNNFQARLHGIDKTMDSKWKKNLDENIESYKNSIDSESENKLINKLNSHFNREANRDIAFILSVILSNKIISKYFPNIYKKINNFVKDRVFNRNNIINSLSSELKESVQKIIKDIFAEKQHAFESEIKNSLRAFVRKNIKLIVSKSLWCDSQEQLLSEFKVEALEKIINDISVTLHKRIRENFMNKLSDLNDIRKKIRNSIGISVSIRLTYFKKEIESYIKSVSLENLTQISQILFEDMFKYALKEEIEDMTIYNLDSDETPTWLPIESFNFSITENDELFLKIKNYGGLNDSRKGNSSDYWKVLDKYMLYFYHNKNDDSDKYLFQVTDGEVSYANVGYCSEIINILKKLNVKIISTVTQTFNTQSFPSKNKIRGSYGYDFLFNSSSELKDFPDFVMKGLIESVSNVSQNSKMIFSLNDEDNLKKLLNAIAEEK